MNDPIEIQAKVWTFMGKAAWVFVTIPQFESEMIRGMYGHLARGWKSLPVKATLGATTWTTSIFPDKESGGYFLPLKAEVRKKENVKDGEVINLSLEITA